MNGLLYFVGLVIDVLFILIDKWDMEKVLGIIRGGFGREVFFIIIK